MELSVFSETKDIADESDAEKNSKADADASACLNGFHRSPTPCHVDKCSIVEHGGGLVGGEREETPAGTVGQGAVGIQGVIPVVESRLVEVDIADYRVATVVARREGDNIAGLKEGHGSGCMGSVG